MYDYDVAIQVVTKQSEIMIHSGLYSEIEKTHIKWAADELLKRLCRETDRLPWTDIPTALQTIDCFMYSMKRYELNCVCSKNELIFTMAHRFGEEVALLLV